MYVVKPGQYHERKLALIAASMFANKKLYDEKTEDLADFKDIDDLEPFNVHVDELGIKTTLMSCCVTIISDCNELVSGEVGKILAEAYAGREFPYLFESEDYVTSIAKITIEEGGTYSVGNTTRCKNLPICEASYYRDSISQTPLSIRSSDLDGVIDNAMSHRPVNSAERLCTIIYDSHDLFNVDTFQQLDVNNLDHFKQYGKLVVPKQVLLKRYDDHMSITDVSEIRTRGRDDVHIPQNVKYTDWKNIKPMPIDPVNYQSINCLLTQKMDPKSLIKMNPDMRDDICVKCKGYLHTDIYVLRANNDVCICCTCVMINLNFHLIKGEYTIIRTVHPRKFSEAIDLTDNPDIYKQYMKHQVMGVDFKHPDVELVNYWSASMLYALIHPTNKKWIIKT